MPSRIADAANHFQILTFVFLINCVRFDWESTKWYLLTFFDYFFLYFLCNDYVISSVKLVTMFRVAVTSCQMSTLCASIPAKRQIWIWKWMKSEGYRFETRFMPIARWETWLLFWIVCTVHLAGVFERFISKIGSLFIWSILMITGCVIRRNAKFTNMSRHPKCCRYHQRARPYSIFNSRIVQPWHTSIIFSEIEDYFIFPISSNYYLRFSATKLVSYCRNVAQKYIRWHSQDRGWNQGWRTNIRVTDGHLTFSFARLWLRWLLFANLCSFFSSSWHQRFNWISNKCWFLSEKSQF